MLLGKQTPIWGGVFTRFEDIDRNTFALVSFDEMTQAVEEQRRAAAEKLESERRSAQELAIAKQVQARLFPQTFPALKTLEYAGLCSQGSPVGGDYYDFLNLGRERVGLVLGDIAGKGIAGALLMANLQANLRSQCAVAWDDPQRLLQSVNELFYDNTADNAYATLFFADTTTRRSACGTPTVDTCPPCYSDADDTLVRLDSTCTVLGLFKNGIVPIGRMRPALRRHPHALYGRNTESFNAAGEEFGEHRLVEAYDGIVNCPSGSCYRIVDEVHQFSPCEQ